jgi:tetratricopeptide (TPR) repeat protein
LRGNYFFLRTPHYTALGAAIVLIVALYLGVNTVPPPKAPVAATAGDAPHNHAGEMPGSSVVPASTDSISTAALMQLPPHAAQELKAIEQKFTAASDSAAMAPVYEELAKLWQEHKNLPMAAYSWAKAAHLAHSEKKLNFAGRFFLDLIRQGNATPAVMMWEARQAISCFNEALAINPDNDTTKLALASGYIDGTGEVMKGVGILREITAKDPNHIPANLMLGRMSIQSGQFDKAVTRFETVLKLDPNNREALYFGAEAYKGKGDKAKAIALFEQCKKVVNNPAFSSDIDNYIKTFK